MNVRSRLQRLHACLGAMLLLVSTTGCSPVGFGNVPEASSLRVEITQGDTGSPGKRLPITFHEPTRFTVKIDTVGKNGRTDTKFTGYVRVSAKPGSVASLEGPNVRGRNAYVQNGVAEGVIVNLIAAYGDTRIWAEDVGYTPNGSPKPRCSDGQDNDGDGLFDFPSDPGCALADDDTENTGSFATGSSETMYFAYPRVADVRGVDQGGAATPFPKEQVLIDTGYDRATNNFDHSLVVTRVAPDGFYVTDIDDPRGYASVLAYTFNPPAKMRPCDRLVLLSGTAADFFGFTELNFPAWAVEEWICKKDHAPGQPLPPCDGVRSSTEACCNRACTIPEPHVLDTKTLHVLKEKLRWSAALVRVQADPAHDVDLRITRHFGKQLAKGDGTTFTFEDEASNCDINGNAKIDFDRQDEANCSNACDADPECSEWTGFSSRSDFDLVLEEKGPERSQFTKVQANATGAPDFDVLATRGKSIRSFSGTFRYFSGGSQFTIEARCEDDITIDPNETPKPQDQTCVIARTASDNNVGSQ